MSVNNITNDVFNSTEKCDCLHVESVIKITKKTVDYECNKHTNV